ncbi:ATP-dependent DNA helicase [Candidatus Woesearchaeota archaeon]|nr:ATP-dependent DNA helicase [Candidatus Woesearchaeota archaeon]MCF7901094.1 ATP-dependent DNA helicase [Candidatus Woesearchaeota archaeon]MCF8013427.1 ATP-dependent DNA helicase [Candidatus Woesearchaeota archaeon]
MATTYFPYDEVRDIQIDLVNAIHEAVSKGNNLIAHAPTGLGKTAASIAAALSNSIKTDKTIFFLTSMHTQHKIAIDTIRDIKKKHDVKLVAVDIIGKRHMCLQPGVSVLSTKDFSDYCRALREDNKCSFYSNLKKGEEHTFNTKAAVSEIKEISPVMTDEMIDISSKHEVCPYEIGLIIGKSSKVIIADYYYLFHPRIRDSFLNKIDKLLEDAIIVIDEAHNLPRRIKDLASEKISNVALKRALSEAEKFNKENVIKPIQKIISVIEGYDSEEQEIYVSREDFIDKINEIMDYYDLVEVLESAADDVREEQKYSYIGSISQFLIAWAGNDEGFTRIFSKSKGLQEDFLSLMYKCLDPGIISKPVMDQAFSTIIMSGTLTPTYMYKEVLGFDAVRTKELTLESPFPQDNKLNIIIPKTSTKFTTRGDSQYMEMAKVITQIVNIVPGNSAVFFPSYQLRDDVYKYLSDCEKTIFIEKPGLSKNEKEEMIENFKGYKNSGAVLMGVTSGSFGEGIDLPGDYLKCVIVVGLPLNRPGLETKALINYYDRKFAKGWDYGYVFPAFNRTLQSAGRCIRSETDRGVVIFLDERYSWDKYMRCFPKDWNLKVTLLYESMIRKFFNVKPEEKAKSLNDY